MQHILKVESLTHVYSAGMPFEKKALDSVTLSVEKGEFLGIIGHTGSGKSTLIQHFNGLLKPTSGRVLINGEDIHESKDSLRAARFVAGLVFQYPENQLFEETVRKDIAFGPKNMGLSAEEIERRVLSAAQISGIPESLLEKSPFELSGGEKRRVALAGVFAMEPEILVLDEPMAGLDPMGRREISQYIKDYQERNGTTIILVTHSMEDAAKLCSRIAVMQNGEIIMDGAPGYIFGRAQELIDSGLDVPQITRVFLKLREKGVDISQPVYTVGQAFEALKTVKEGGNA